MRWKRVIESTNGEQTDTNGETVEQNGTDNADLSIKKEDERIELRQEPSSFETDVVPKVDSTEDVSSAKPSVKLEEISTAVNSSATDGLFRKRKVPSTGARGRRK